MATQRPTWYPAEAAQRRATAAENCRQAAKILSEVAAWLDGTGKTVTNVPEELVRVVSQVMSAHADVLVAGTMFSNANDADEQARARSEFNRP